MVSQRRQNLLSQQLPRSLNYAVSPSVPPTLHTWLTLSGSLTRHLKRQHDDFSVQILSESWSTPLLAEAKILHLRLQQKAWIRCVALWGNGQPVVYARTVMPVKTIHALGHRLRHLSTTSLGEFVFCHPHMRRGRFHTLHLSAEQAVYQQLYLQLPSMPKQQPLWGRGSVFTLNQSPLLVSEYFLRDMPPISLRF